MAFHKISLVFTGERLKEWPQWDNSLAEYDIYDLKDFKFLVQIRNWVPLK